MPGHDEEKRGCLTIESKKYLRTRWHRNVRLPRRRAWCSIADQIQAATNKIIPGSTMTGFRLRFLAVLLAASFAFEAGAITGEKAEFKKLAEGVYAYVGKLNDANAMAIVTPQGVVVVDTGNNQPESR